MKAVAAAIYDKLASATGSGTFHALVNGRYYHMEAPQNTGFPLAVFALESPENEDQFGGSRILRGAVTFDIYVEAKTGAAVAMDIEEALFGLLDQSALTASSPYGAVTLQCLARGVPSTTDEFVIISTSYSLFTTRDK